MKTLVTGNGNKLSYFRQKTHKYTYVCTHTYMPICTSVCVCVYGERERESITGSAGARESDLEVTAELRPSPKLMLQRESAGPTPCCLHRRHQSWTITLSVHTCYLREVASGAHCGPTCQSPVSMVSAFFWITRFQFKFLDRDI